MGFGNHSGPDQPGYRTDAEYRHSIHRYLGWLGATCLIVSCFLGSGAILLWIIVAIVLTAGGPASGRDQTASKSCTGKGRRNC